MSSPVIRYDPVPLNSARNASNPSLRSRSSANSGPSNKEPAFITSTWGIGWKTPALRMLDVLFGVEPSRSEARGTFI